MTKQEAMWQAEAKGIIARLHERRLLGSGVMNDENRKVLDYGFDHWPAMGVARHVLDGCDELMNLEPTEKIERAIAWTAITVVQRVQDWARVHGNVKLKDGQGLFKVTELKK